MKNLIKKTKIFGFICVLCLCLISIQASFINAKKYSIDFQYSPSKLLLEGINHYKYILDGKHDYSLNDKIMEHQNGEYAHGLYVLFLPFGKETVQNNCENIHILSILHQGFKLTTLRL